MRLHPIMYVPDQYAERDFYRHLGFEDHYEGDELPGFLAMRSGEALIGLQRATSENPRYAEGLRWQFQVDTGAELDDLLARCQLERMSYELSSETGGSLFASRLLSVIAPSGVAVVFEGPNDAAS